MTGTLKKPRSVRPEVRAAVLELVQQIPRGEVASYGMIASLLEGVTARMVGHALNGASSTDGPQVPWQRVINASGQVSAHEGSLLQRELLAEEGIAMTDKGRIRWRGVRWSGPNAEWLDTQGLDPIRLMEIMADWP